ncbi:hypothetical protein NXW04_12035 [Phocaeicola vulgatus]|nr:hypothetical protein [Phocaeicola vulgatus]
MRFQRNKGKAACPPGKTRHPFRNGCAVFRRNNVHTGYTPLEPAPGGHTGSCSIRGTMNCWTGMTIMRRVCPSGLTPLTGEAHISEVQKFCCSSAFSERLEYRNPKRVRIQPAAFVQKLNIKINVSGNTVPLSGLNCTLSGISTARYLASRERTGTASATASFAKKADNVWTAGLYVFGFSPAAENILAVEVLMKEEDSVFNERQSVDLTPYLRGFDGDEISLELDLHIGRELEIGGPVIIPDWEDTPETEFP